MEAELLCRIDRAEALAFRHAIFDVAQIVSGRRPGDRLLEIGGCYAFTSPQTHLSMYNRVLAFTSRSLRYLDEILERYTELGIPPRFDLCPLNTTDAMRTALRDRGFVLNPGEFYARRMWQLPSRIALGAAPDVEVRELTEETCPAWVAIDEAVFVGFSSNRAARLRATFAAPRFHRFLAFIDGEPVALGRLEVIDGIALLNGAGTLEAFRRRGCQRALTHRRMLVAKELGCDAITSLAKAGSQSARNLYGAGLTQHSDREVWMRPDWEAHPFYAS